MSSRYSQVSFYSYGYELPPQILTSDEIEHRLEPVYQRLKLPGGRLEMMSGIRERRLWPHGTRPSEAATKAGLKTIAGADIDPLTIECLIFTSVSRDMMEPATASFVHNGLKLSSNCLLLDISNACLGFLDGVIMLANMIELGQVRNGLIVSGETAESLVVSTIHMLLEDKKLTRKSFKSAFASLTIGSGSIGLYMCHSEDDDRGTPRLNHCAWMANTTHSDLCQGGAAGTDHTLMATNSEELLVQGVDTARLTWNKFMVESGWQPGDVDCFFCHQVGTAHARMLFDKLELDPKKNFETLPFLGNVGSVSAPITMAMAMEQKVFTPGQKGAMLGIGSGINCMMLGIEW